MGKDIESFLGYGIILGEHFQENDDFGVEEYKQFLKKEYLDFSQKEIDSSVLNDLALKFNLDVQIGTLFNDVLEEYDLSHFEVFIGSVLWTDYSSTDYGQSNNRSFDYNNFELFTEKVVQAKSVINKDKAKQINDYLCQKFKEYCEENFEMEDEEDFEVTFFEVTDLTFRLQTFYKVE